MPAWEIARLSRKHERSAFDCGRQNLNDWMKTLAGQYDRRDLSRTYVATAPGQWRVLGYYALSTHRVMYDALPNAETHRLPRFDVPIVLLGKLAVDVTMQQQGLGTHLLVDALRRSVQIADEVGVRAIEVDALNERARQFYLQFGFRSLLDDLNHLYLPMHEIRKLRLDTPTS